MRRIFIAACALFALACTEGRNYDQVVSVLIDVSGTYADERRQAVDIVKREILPHMVPGDTLLVVRIDSESYDRENVEALLTLDRRPSHANAQKLAVARRLDAFAAERGGAQHTDIPGALMLASEYLGEIEAGSRVILVFSDMLEDLPPGTSRRLAKTELDGAHVVAMNVKHLGRDNANPDVYRKRLAQWERRVGDAGAEDWRTVMDPAKLPDYLASIR